MSETKRNHATQSKGEPVAAIDFLRAIAVLMVVAYHYFPKHFKFGFVGVDIFFVISGYVVSKSIFSKSQFNFKSFLFARIRRLAPAHLLMLALLGILSQFYSLPSDARLTSEAILFNIFGLQNFYFQEKSGYFDQIERSIPNLNTWSLAVEEQFYILFALMILILRFRLRKVASLILSFSLISLFLTFLIGRNHPAATFYLLPFRFFELGCGILAFTIRSKCSKASNFKYKRKIALVLMLLIAISILFVKRDQSFPNLSVLPLIVATSFFVLIADTFENNHFLAFRPMQYLGKTSYSIYLYHYPALVLFQHATLRFPKYGESSLVLMVSLLFSFVSYHVVEKPLRKSNRFTNSDLRKICAILLTVITVTNLVTMNFYDKLHGLTATQKQFLTYYSREGNSTYLKTIVEQSARTKCDEESSNSRRKNSLEALPVNCILNKGMNQGTIILWGDSHAMHLRWGLLYSTSNSQFIVLTKDGCGARIQLSQDLNDGCSQYRYFATQIVSLAPKSQVIISQVTPWEYDDLKTIRDYVEKRGHSLLVVGAAPSFVAPFSEVFVNKLWYSGENSTNLAIDSRWVEQDKQNSVLAKKLEVKYVSLYKIFCHKAECKFRLRSGSNSIFSWDYSHLTESGSRFAVSKFRKSLEDSSN